MSGFSNKSIIPLRYNKPHICFRDVWWRVSQLHSGNFKYKELFYKAHNFTIKLNHEISFNSRKLIITGISKSEFENVKH